MPANRRRYRELKRLGSSRLAHFTITQDLDRQVRAYAKKHQCGTWAAAVRALLRQALETPLPTPPVLRLYVSDRGVYYASEPIFPKDLA